ncbi:MAG: large conductance mechanosensitive channel protein MscL [Tissierellia bacterium]|nr:large conductance mechanosensitive channel protein MscL [Tissierellia bacterium]
MIKEFKEFISRGNVIDLAVGVVIGGAFGAIVTSLVEDIIMPLVGLILGGLNFAGLSIKVGEAEVMYGNFIQVVVNFLIIAFCIFLVIKAINKFKKPEEVAVTTKVCPFCKSEIDLEATRCPHCTSELVE